MSLLMTIINLGLLIVAIWKSRLPGHTGGEICHFELINYRYHTIMWWEITHFSNSTFWRLVFSHSWFIIHLQLDFCSKLMLDYFDISNMYVNHAIVVIWVLLLDMLNFSEYSVKTYFVQHFYIVLACGSFKIKDTTSIIIDIVSDRIAGHFDTIYGLIDLLFFYN